MDITKRLTSALLMLVLTGLSIQSHADQRGTSQEALLLLDNAIERQLKQVFADPGSDKSAIALMRLQAVDRPDERRLAGA